MSGLQKYNNDFLYGRDLLKKLLIIMAVTAVGSLLVNGIIQNVLVWATIIMFCASIWILVKYCRCPHCGNTIFLGVLAIKQCPHCKHDLATGRKLKKSKK